jgi:hypothetical protein
MESGGKIGISKTKISPSAKPASDIGNYKPHRMMGGGKVGSKSKRLARGGKVGYNKGDKPTYDIAESNDNGQYFAIEEPRNYPKPSRSKAKRMQMGGPASGVNRMGRQGISTLMPAGGGMPMMRPRAPMRMKRGGDVGDFLLNMTPHRLLGLRSYLDPQINEPKVYTSADYPEQRKTRAGPSSGVQVGLRKGGKVKKYRGGGYIHGGKPPKR